MTAIPVPPEVFPIPGLPHAPPIDLRGLPSPGEIISVPIRGVQETWHDVWGWVHHTAQPAVNAIASTIADELTKIIPVIEAYVGQQLKAVGSVINNVGDFAYTMSDYLWQVTTMNLDWTVDQIIGMDLAIYGTISHIVGIESVALPWLAELAGGAYDYAWNIAHAIGFDIMNWVLDSVYSPVIAELAAVEAGIRADVWSLVDAVAGSLTDMIEGVDADLLARLGLLAGIAAATLTWVENCGDPMCRLMGPATDLGKLFQAFEAAGILALLMEIGNMTEGDVEDRLRELAGEAQRIVGAFEGTFVGGGGTLRDFALDLL